MGGDVAVESEYGKGSVFTAHIPQRVLDPRPFVSVETAALPQGGKKQTEVKFIAPDVRVLAVDDIETNLTVLSGLLAPYQMLLTLCASGEEAVRLVKNNPFDFVLMDHMMPGMDGVETVAQIRKWEESRQTLETTTLSFGGAETQRNPRKRIPIIALTANAVSGMREMFLKQGFDDFLSKPMEIAKLDELIAKWTPAEKKLAIRGVEPGGADRGQEKVEALLVIPGVDTVKGVALCGGTVEAYKKVLSMFRKDAEERLALFKDFLTCDGPVGENNFSAEDLEALTIQAHAIKSAAGTIGAAELSAAAAALEAAGKAGDPAAIYEALPAFTEHLAALMEEIKKTLEPEGKKNSAGAISSPMEFEPRLRALRRALEKKDIESVDRLLAELEENSPDKKTTETVNAVSDLVLMCRFEDAVDLTEKLLGGRYAV
jgi:CheY-like chemotaxis protein